MGNQLGGIELERQENDLGLGHELDALSSSLIKGALELATSDNIPPLLLHFDELDQGLTRLDDERSRMLIGLILAAREIRRESRQLGTQVNPVVYLRTDIWDDLEFSDKNKISQSGTLHLEWKSESLSELVEARVRAKVSSQATWQDIAEPTLMRGSQTKWNHMLARTFLRPRDVIRFLNSALAESKKRSNTPIHFTNKDIVNCREEYSAYLKQELDDEILPHWRQWEEALQACSAISTITFDKAEFVEEYTSRRSRANDIMADDALKMLYRFSVIGYERRSGYGGRSWAFQYTDPEAGWDTQANKFKVHLGLKEYAKLREKRL